MLSKGPPHPASCCPYFKMRNQDNENKFKIILRTTKKENKPERKATIEAGEKGWIGGAFRDLRQTEGSLGVGPKASAQGQGRWGAVL